MSAPLLELKEIISVLSQDPLFDLHLDFMDGQFVQNLTFGTRILRDLKGIDLNVHLMVQDPLKYLKECSFFNIKYLALHYENLPSLSELESYKNNVDFLGLVINQKIDPSIISPEVLHFFDYFLLMSVEAGADAQEYTGTVESKILFFQKNYPQKLLQVDGGLDLEKMKHLKSLGITYFITGSWFFKDWKNHITALKREFN